MQYPTINFMCESWWNKPRARMIFQFVIGMKCIVCNAKLEEILRQQICQHQRYENYTLINYIKLLIYKPIESYKCQDWIHVIKHLEFDTYLRFLTMKLKNEFSEAALWNSHTARSRHTSESTLKRPKVESTQSKLKW